jgi:periplasmic protein TonB
MATKNRKYPSLDDIAFDGRNQSYGSYYLRRMYYRFLAVSVLFGVFVLSLLVMVPFIIYYVDGSGLTDSMEEIYSVDYAFMPPPGDDLNELARLAAQPLEEMNKVPVVVDSMPNPEEKKKDEVKTEEEKKEEEPGKDSVAPGTGQSEQGSGPGEDTGIYTTIDVYPRFPGGDKARIYFLRTHIHYPEIALKAGMQGTIMVVFVIEIDGSISNIEISKGINKYCDEEAVRVIKSMPGWEPGKRSGRPVRVMVRMPIIFKIPAHP